MKSSSPVVAAKHKRAAPVPKPITADTAWATSAQVLRRYSRSQMWLWRKIKHDPAFPKPVYDGRWMMFSVAELDAYDRALLSKRVGAK
jgi:predicted DNA-binding transcriptional regulator AlpA